MELVFSTLFHRLYFVVTQKCVNMSHVKDWCIGFILLCNKLPQILCLKTTFIIDSLCGSSLWIRLSWVPLAPGLSKLWWREFTSKSPHLPIGRTQILGGCWTEVLIPCWQFSEASLSLWQGHMGFSMGQLTRW